ncbi:MAG: hypothetical protein EOP53_18550 [Sphingobacteriales bacterium]|nr:MAG: hypothetical protein EOP53_18550 [Sphingobacteriales bacterium]
MFKIKPKKILYSYFSLAPYMFFDAGIINTGSDFKNSPLRMDAGLGTALTIKSWGKYQKAAPLTLRFDMPFLLDPSPYNEQQNFKFRWIAGIGRAF